MPRTPAAKGRSASRGRAAGAKKTPAAKKTPVVYKMEFEEGDQVMAKWPGTALFFKSKVTYVRDDDNEYDVQFEDGTVYTLKAKEVKKFAAKDASSAAKKKTPSRSRSRGRSPGRAKKGEASPSRPKAAAVKSNASFTAPKPEPTPTRQSARIAARADAISDDDETHGKKAIPNPSHSRGSSKRGPLAFFKSLSFEWVGVLLLMAFFPLVLVSLHTLCTKTSCKPAMPVLPKTLKGYWDPQAFGLVVGFSCILRVLSMVPLGSVVKTATGHEVRMNGFLSLLTLLALVPVAYYRQVDLSIVGSKYFYLMTSALVASALMSLIARIAARFCPGKKTNVNPKGNTGNLIVDFFHGREFNPWILGTDTKLHVFRLSMIGLALVNVALVVDDIVKHGGKVNPLVVMASAFQVIYASDAMFFEEYFFFSHDAMNSGFGFSLVSSYMSLPFLPTLITRYLIARG